MEKDEEYLHNFFTFLSQNQHDKAKDHIEKQKQIKKTGVWYLLLVQLSQLVLAEKSYMDLCFLQNKIKGFLRKDNSLNSLYESIKYELKKIEDSTRTHCLDRNIINYCQNVSQFVKARLQLIEFYERVYIMGQKKTLNYNEAVEHIENIIEQNALAFSDISLTSIKAVFGLECDILVNLFKALVKLRKLQFFPSLVLINGAHTGLQFWESKLQSRETWKLGFIKNTQWPSLFQWLTKFKGALISKFGLYFHHVLSQQTTQADMKQICSKLQYDTYQKIAQFHRKHDGSTLILSDAQFVADNFEQDSFPIIISYPQKICSNLDTIIQMISDSCQELTTIDRIIYKYLTEENCTYVFTLIEPTVYLVIIFESKKTDKDVYINNFITDLCVNLRCTKVFLSLKEITK